MPRSILIVDDYPANLKLAEVLLMAEGCDVRMAADAEAALEILRDFQPRLILVDIQLPGMDGLEFTRLVKSNVKTSAINVVALSACTLREDAERARACGCCGYIAKPIDIRHFGAEVVRYLQAPASAAKA